MALTGQPVYQVSFERNAASKVRCGIVPTCIGSAGLPVNWTLPCSEKVSNLLLRSTSLIALDKIDPPVTQSQYLLHAMLHYLVLQYNLQCK